MGNSSLVLFPSNGGVAHSAGVVFLVMYHILWCVTQPYVSLDFTIAKKFLKRIKKFALYFFVQKSIKRAE